MRKNEFDKLCQMAQSKDIDGVHLAIEIYNSQRDLCTSDQVYKFKYSAITSILQDSYKEKIKNTISNSLYPFR